MPAGVETKLDFMIDVQSNLQTLADQFRKQAGTISLELTDIKAKTQNWGISLGDVITIQMAQNFAKAQKSGAEFMKMMIEMVGKFVKKSKPEIEEMQKRLGEFTDKSEKYMKKSDTFEDAMLKKRKQEKKDDEKLAKLAENAQKAQKEQNANLGFFGRLAQRVSKAAGGMFGVITKGAAEFETQQSLMQTALSHTNKEQQSLFKRLKDGMDRAIEDGGLLGKGLQVIRFAFRTAGKAAVVFGESAIGAMKGAAGIAKIMWRTIMGPVGMVMKLVGNLLKLLGGLSFINAIKSSVDLDAAVNDIARTMTGGVESSKKFGETTKRLMTDIKDSAMDAGAAVQDMSNIYATLAGQHIPVGDLKGLADMSFEAAKGLGMSYEQSTQLVGTLQHVGRLSQKEIKGVLNQFAALQQSLGLSAAETQGLAQNIMKTTGRLRQMGATSKVIRSYTRATTSLAATFIQVGLEADAAAQKVADLFNPDQLENNIALYSQLGMSVTKASAIMQGSSEIPEDMAAKFVKLSKRIASMGPIAGKEYAKAMNMSYGMAQQLAGLTEDQVGKVNKIMGRTAKGADDVLKKQRDRQRKQTKEQFEEARNRMALLMIDVIQPIMELLRDFMTRLNKAFKDARPYIKQIADWMGQAAGMMSKLIAPLFELVGRVAKVFFGGGEDSIFNKALVIVQKIVDMVMKFMPIVERILTTLADSFMTIVPPILDAVMTVTDALQPAIEAALGFVQQIIGPITDLITSLISALMPTIRIIVKALGPVFETFGNIIGDIINNLKGPLTHIFQAISKVLEAIMPAIINIIKALKPIFDAFSQLWGMIGDMIAKLMVKLAPALSKIFDVVAMIMQMLGPIIQSIVDALGPVIDAMMPALDLAITLTNTILDLLGPLLKYLLNIIVIVIRLAAKYVELITKVFKWIFEKFDKLFKTIHSLLHIGKREEKAPKPSEAAKEGFFAELFKGLNWQYNLQTGAGSLQGAGAGAGAGAEAGAGAFQGKETTVKAVDLSKQINKQTTTTTEAKQIQQETAEQMVSRLDTNAELMKESTIAMKAVAEKIEDIRDNAERTTTLLARLMPQIAERV